LFQGASPRFLRYRAREGCQRSCVRHPPGIHLHHRYVHSPPIAFIRCSFTSVASRGTCILIAFHTKLDIRKCKGGLHIFFCFSTFVLYCHYRISDPDPYWVATVQ
jgi:hypothetical protein